MQHSLSWKGTQRTVEDILELFRDMEIEVEFQGDIKFVESLECKQNCFIIISCNRITSSFTSEGYVTCHGVTTSIRPLPTQTFKFISLWKDYGSLQSKCIMQAF